MSVVLRGIDKPSDCDYCPFQSDSYCSLLLSYIIVEHGVDPRCLISEISGYTLKNGHRVVISVDDEGRERHEIHLDRKTEPTISKMEQVDEPQKETEIAKAIVHKMIDDAVIAEDAYPDLRQKMHDAVDEYEPQTDCAWKEGE